MNIPSVPLPEPLFMTAQANWRDMAACRDLDGDLFFPEGNEVAGGALVKAVAEARQVCRRCPVRTACLGFALRAGEADGIWAGLTGRELRAERLRGGPRPAEEVIADFDARYDEARERAVEMRRRRLARIAAGREPGARKTEEEIAA